MAVKEKLPMGIEDFEEIRTMGYYYVDKTGLIRTLIENFGKVNLFTRPRRFGKQKKSFARTIWGNSLSLQSA